MNRSNTTMLSIIDHIPDGLIDVEPTGLFQILQGPTLTHLPGSRPEPLLVPLLLHGNEDTGLRAAQAVLRRHAERQMPRALSLFIGNVAAAREGVRRLEEQPDYNRVWPGSIEPRTPEHGMMEQVVEEMRRRRVFASVDVHNNSGLNPHYSCVSRLDPRALHLCTLFSRTVVFFERPLGVQVSAFNDLCPAVTLECGKPGATGSAAQVADFIEGCLHLAEFPTHRPRKQDLDLYHTVATVKIPPNITFSFSEGGCDLTLVPDLDHMNFCELAARTVWGRVRSGCGSPLEVTDTTGASVFERYFTVGRGELRLARSVMPAMLTQDARAIRQDCLCYLMERLLLP